MNAKTTFTHTSSQNIQTHISYTNTHTHIFTYINIAFLQIIVQVEDRGIPANVAVETAQILVFVQRNINTPQFTNTPYATTIQENFSVGTSIFQVFASDADTPGTYDEVNYEIIGDESAPVFFEVEPTTGIVRVRQDLSSASDSVYVSFNWFLR